MLRKIFFTVVIVGGLVLAIAALARFSDGPVGPFPGGPLQGEIISGPEPLWSELIADEEALELQVNASDPRSLRVWFVLYNGAIHVPSAWASRKEWPAQVEADPRTVVRTRGRMYDRQATRVTDPATVEALIDLVAEKYDTGRGDPDTTWFFRLDPPRP
jgi:hypothetical protein